MATLWDAVQGKKKRGERWWHVAYGDLELGRHVNLGDEGIVVTGGQPVPIDGWTRVEEPLRCPRCGKIMDGPHRDGHMWSMGWCTGCGLNDKYVYSSAAEAREAWLKIGGKR